MKQYPLEIKPVRETEGGRHIVELFSKGHQNTVAFVNAIEAEYDITVSEVRIRYLWWKAVPFPLGGYTVHPVDQTARGAFPVTVVEF